jgi:tRNA pseudouridine55 synthase
MYSAKKVDGKRLYELARKGVEIEREPKRINIYSIDVISIAVPEVTIDVSCSAGTYLRVLAEDIGEKLGCGGYLLRLRRTAAGPFTLEDALTLDELADHPELARDRIVPLGRALSELPRINVPPSIGQMIASGHQLNVADLRTLDIPPFECDVPVMLGLDGGRVIAVARSLIASTDLPSCRRDRRALKTERVFARD